MIRMIVRRLVSGLVLIVIVGIGVFFLTHAVIGNPAASLLGNGSTRQQRSSLNERLGITEPLGVQFRKWISQIFGGDLGSSWKTQTSVSSDLANKLPVTLSIVIAATVVCVAIGFILGIVAGRHPDGVLDACIKGLNVILFALPGFWVALVLVTWFSVDMRLLPAIGYVPLTSSFSGWVASILLPSVSLALPGVVSVAEQLRNSYVQEDGKDYVRTLRSRGLSEWQVTRRIVRNASPAAITTAGLQFIGLFGGAVIIEQVFSLPGIGSWTTTSSNNGDIPALIGISLASVVVIVIVNIVTDLVLAWINPKLRR